MGGGGRTSNGEDGDKGVQCLRHEVTSNGFGFENHGGDGSSVGNYSFCRTYKRRRHTGSSSESKGQDDRRDSVETASKMVEQATNEPSEHLPENYMSLNGLNDVSRKQWRNFVLEHWYQSLTDDVGGIRRCIGDALAMTDSDAREKHRNKLSLQAGCRPHGNHYATKGHGNVIFNGALDESQHQTSTEMCRRVFLNIILSEKFTSMCKLLFENFQGMRAENFFNLTLINRRMKEGAYETSPMLFSEDIQQLWRKIERIGTELISFGNSLSDLSRTCYNEQVGGSMHIVSEDVKCELRTPESDSHGRADQTEAFVVNKVCTCKRCGLKADGSDCLVCDACEEIYHVSCIEPAAKEIPPKSWYCASCAASGLGSPHENCVVCERLYPCSNSDGDRIGRGNEEIFDEFEETSNFCMEGGIQLSECGKNVHCKICGGEVEDGEKLKMCNHAFCLNKYYHVRCLTKKQLKSYGPRWYCPSCLCRACLTDQDDDKIVLCDGCDHAYHLYCMSPPQTSVPRGKWFCRQCDVKIRKIRKARREYNKQQIKIRKLAERQRRREETFEKKLNEKREEKKLQAELAKGRERMDILLNAALSYDEKFAANKS